MGGRWRVGHHRTGDLRWLSHSVPACRLQQALKATRTAGTRALRLRMLAHPDALPPHSRTLDYLTVLSHRAAGSEVRSQLQRGQCKMQGFSLCHCAACCFTWPACLSAMQRERRTGTVTGLKHEDKADSQDVHWPQRAPRAEGSSEA
jgi:hypothetical protein